MSWSRSFLCLGVVAQVFRAIPSMAAPDVTLWVIQPPGEVVAFDLANFSRVGGVRIPPVAFNDPGLIAINGWGQMLVQLDADHLWLWDGDVARTLPTSPERVTSPNVSPEPLRRWLLGDDGKSLYTLEEGSGQVGASTADSASSSLLIVRATNLSQRPRDSILVIPREPCNKPYDFDVGSEPCPNPDIWAPGGVVRECFLLMHWEQESSTETESPIASCHYTLYRRGAVGWSASDLGIWGRESLLDVNADGSAWGKTVEDEACCGSSNSSSDQAVFGNADTALTLFDEWSSFHNQNYDMSFFTAKARVAPGGGRVAFAIHATEAPGAKIPASNGGHPDTLELASIQRSLADLPIVEVHAMRPNPTLLLRLRHAELVGWASDSEVL
ncbi:MAG TPA: hypothetical protein VJW23_20045, partial [Propionibacteriaceae bacterium]|nr:hypothetical protein [Propionibacteriaceae bacterium]